MMMKAGRTGLQLILILHPAGSVGSVLLLEMFSFYLQMYLEDEGSRKACMVKAETQVSIQLVMLNNHMFHKIACLGHSS